MPETLLDRVRACEDNYSRGVARYASRIELKQLLSRHDLDVARALLFVDRVAMLDPNCTHNELVAIIRRACAAAQPFQRYV